MVSPLAKGSPELIDMVVVREGTEGPYTGAGGVMRRGTAQELATQESFNPRFGAERVADYQPLPGSPLARAASAVDSASAPCHDSMLMVAEKATDGTGAKH